MLEQTPVMAPLPPWQRVKNSSLFKLPGLLVIGVVVLIGIALFNTLFSNDPHVKHNTPAGRNISVERPTERINCGGTTAIRCLSGYSCELNGNSPDAGGICIKDEPFVTTEPLSPDEYPSVIEAAQHDVASTLGLTLTYVHVISVSDARWSDSNLGCPGPGTAYTQAFVPGYKVVLEAQGKRYEYHTGKSRHFILCTMGTS